MDFIRDFLKQHCRRRHRDREISLNDRKIFYDLLIAGNIEDFKREFKKVTEKNVLSLKFSNYCWNPIHLAIWHGQRDILEFLLKSKYKDEWINEKDELNGETPIFLGFFRKKKEICQDLLRSGANLKVQNRFIEKYQVGDFPFDLIQDMNEKQEFLGSLLSILDETTINYTNPNFFFLKSTYCQLRGIGEINFNEKPQNKEEAFEEWPVEEEGLSPEMTNQWFANDDRNIGNLTSNRRLLNDISDQKDHSASKKKKYFDERNDDISPFSVHMGNSQILNEISEKNPNSNYNSATRRNFNENNDQSLSIHVDKSRDFLL